jgi:hypothetical protein
MKPQDVLTWLETVQHVKIEPSPLYVRELDRVAERSGGVTKDKARSMRQAVKLPVALWPEIDRATVYLHNRTPRYQYNWKSSYDLRINAQIRAKNFLVWLNKPWRLPNKVHPVNLILTLSL